MAGQEDTFSFQEDTLNIADLNELVAQGHAPAGAQHDVGFKSGWKSEKVSGSEIRERLAALATVSAASTATAALHAGAHETVLSATPPLAAVDVGTAPGRPDHGTAADTDTAATVESWSSLLAPDTAGQDRCGDAASLDIRDAEQLLAMSPTDAKRAVELSAGGAPVSVCRCALSCTARVLRCMGWAAPGC
jgi:hypothetical protein